MIQDDILSLIFVYLEVNSLDALFASCTCTQWNRISKSIFGDQLKQISAELIVTSNFLPLAIEKLLPRYSRPLKLLNFAVRRGNIENLRYLFNEIETNVRESKLMVTASMRGDLDILKCVHDHGGPVEENMFCNLIRCGSTDLLQWALDVGCTPTRDDYFSLIFCAPNPREVFEWFVKKGIQKATRNGIALSYAVSRHNLDVLRWIIDEMGFSIPAYVGNHLWNCSTEVLEYFKDKGCLPSQSSILAAASQGRIDFIIWILKHNIYVDDGHLISIVAGSGNLEFLKFLSNVGMKIGVTSMRNAAHGGYVHIMEWLLEKGQCLSEEVFAEGIIGGLDTMNWLLSMNCPTKESYAVSISNKRDSSVAKLELLKSRGLCSIESFKQTIRSAIAYGNLDVIKWLANEIKLDVPEMFVFAKFHNHLDVMKWLWGTFNDQIDSKVVASHRVFEKPQDLDVYEWLLENNLCGPQTPVAVWKKKIQKN